MTANKLYSFLDICYDFNSQEKWDESGLCSFGNKDYDDNKIIVALDLNHDLLDFAIKKDIKLIICHHPILTSSLQDPNSPCHQYVKKLFQHKINLIALHTPFDRDVSGMNVALAQKLKLINIKRVNDHNKYIISGELAKAVKLDKFARDIKNILDTDFVKYIDTYKNKMIKKIAICGGSGGSMVNEVAASEADAYITCDVKYHQWNDSFENKLPVIEVNHEIENIFIDIMCKKIREFDPKTIVFKYRSHLNTVIINK